MKAVLKWVRISPKKANLVAWMVRWMATWEAQSMLKFLNKKWADIIYKLLASAIANAQKNFNQKEDDLILLKISVTPWMTYKRWMSRSKGRVFKILKRTSHINIELWVKEIETWNEVIDVKSKDEGMEDVESKQENIEENKTEAVKKDKKVVKATVEKKAGNKSAKKSSKAKDKKTKN